MEEHLQDPEGTMIDLEEELSRRIREKLFGELTAAVENAGISVFSVYRWAAERNFSVVFDRREYDGDWEYAARRLMSMFDHMQLHEIIDELVSAQARIVWLRRVSEGTNGGLSPHDLREARRYVAFLFFDDMLRLCRNGDCCPKTAISKSSSLILDLLKSLSLEDYCRIKGYLTFRNRHSRSDEAHHSFHRADFLKAMGELDSCFVNCGRSNGDKQYEFHHHLSGNLAGVERAKLNRSDTLGPIPTSTVSRFMENFYGFVSSFSSGETDTGRACQALRELYRFGNARVVNATEFFFKCIISSAVPPELHSKIREECFKVPQLGRS
jgi:hypothetical protein